MYIEGQKSVNATPAAAWAAISDLENAPCIFKAIKSITIVEKPPSSLLGLKWKEVRVFMGKEATETMWITEVEDGKSYTSQAINAGCIYHSGYRLEALDQGVKITKSFRSTPQSVFAKLMSPMMYLMKGTLKKCIEEDLENLKTHLEESL